MAKKRSQEQHDSNSVEVQEEPTVDQVLAAESESSPSENATSSLMDEIQSFMTLREELSQKLASEIEATELKLAELKETAASLFPQATYIAEEKKAKKAKPKVPKEEKSSPSSAAEPEAAAA